MKHVVMVMIVAGAVLAMAPSEVQAQSIRQGGRLGVGIGTGTSTNGLSLKYFVADTQAFQFTAGAGFGNGYLGAGLDYLLELPTLADAGVLAIGWNAGLGAGVGIGGGVLGVGVSGILGLEVLFEPLPIDLVLEWRPTVSVIPSVGFGLVGFTGHIRYYF